MRSLSRVVQHFSLKRIAILVCALPALVDVAFGGVTEQASFSCSGRGLIQANK